MSYRSRAYKFTGMLTFVALRTWSQHLGEERNVSKPRPPSTAHRMLDQDTEDGMTIDLDFMALWYTANVCYSVEARNPLHLDRRVKL